MSLLQDQKLCITLHSKKEIDWDFFCMQINTIMDFLELKQIVLDISDAPVVSININHTIRELEKLHKYRFFTGEKPALQKKWMKQNRKEIKERHFEPLFEQVRRSLNELNDQSLRNVIQEICALIYDSFSFEMYTYVWNELQSLYNAYSKIYNLQTESIPPLSRNTPYRYLSNFEDAVFYMFLQLLNDIRLKRTNTNNAITIVSEYLSEHLGESLTLEYVAKVVHLSPSYLSRLFKKVTGKTFIDILTEKRIQRAKELLVMQLKVSDIGPMVGFENFKYFSQVFKKYTGMTPKEFKLANRKPGGEDEKINI